MSEMKKLFEVTVVIEAQAQVAPAAIESLAEELLDLMRSKYPAIALGPVVSFHCEQARIEIMFNVAGDVESVNRTGTAVSDELTRFAQDFEFQKSSTEVVRDDCELVPA